MTTNITTLTTELEPATIAFLTDLVEDYMTTGRAFTSLDIANAAKEAGHFARNRWVAAWLRTNAIEIAHDLTALYNQTLIEVHSSTAGYVLAYLYHHMDFDPDDYSARSQDPLQTTTRRKQQQPVTVPVGKAAAIAAAIVSGVDPVTAQHQQVVDRRTGGVTRTTNQSTTPQTKGIHRTMGRDAYGRFISDPSDQKPAPTHFLRQKRVHGRFAK